jgi:hypothetical protein
VDYLSLRNDGKLLMKLQGVMSQMTVVLLYLDIEISFNTRANEYT